MVYTGKPSGGCRTCKYRRVKCDESKPVCNRCTKARRECRGYADRMDLVFRHKTSATVACVQNYLHDTRGRLYSLHGTALRICSPPPLHREYVAVNFLFTRIGGNHKLFQGPGNDLELVRQLYATTSPDSALYSATLVMALVVLGHSPAGKGCVSQARTRYAESLSRIRVALEDPVQVRQDQTLMAICLLNPAEVSRSVLVVQRRYIYLELCVSSKMGRAYGGALAITKLRGLEMLNNETSRKLLRSVRRQTTMHRMTQGLSVSNMSNEMIHSMFFQCDFHSPESSNALCNLERVEARIPLLRSRADCYLNEFSLDAIPPVRLLLKDCQYAEKELEYWSNRLAPPSKVKPSIRLGCDLRGFPENLDPPGEDADDFTDIWTAKAWSTYRISKIFVQTIILGCVSWLLNAVIIDHCPSDLELDEQEASLLALLKAREILQELVDQICWSVPYHLGQLEAKFSTQERRKSLSSSILDAENERLALRNVPQPLGHFFIFWPLLVARSVHVIPASQRKMIDNQLVDVAKCAGVDGNMIAQKLNDRFGWPLLERGPVWNGETLD